MGAKITPARAAAFRKLNAELCGCLLCEWSLNPPLTMDEQERRVTETYMRNTQGTWPIHKDWAQLQKEGIAL